MINALVSATSASASVALSLIRPATVAAPVPTALVPAAAQVEARRDQVTLSAEAKRLGGLTEGRSASFESGAAGSSEAAYGRAVQQRIRAILAGQKGPQTVAPSTDPERGKSVPTTTASPTASTSPKTPTPPTSPTLPTAPVKSLTSLLEPAVLTLPTLPTSPLEPLVSPMVEPLVSPVLEPLVSPVVEPLVSPVLEPLVSPMVLTSPTVSTAPTTSTTTATSGGTTLTATSYVVQSTITGGVFNLVA